MTTDHVLQLCQTAPSIADELAKDPSQSVDHVVKRLLKEWKDKGGKSAKKQSEGADGKDRLDRAAACGKFPNRPSDLFLTVYADVLDCISADPFADLVSPSLIGSSGVIPLSIVSVIPDIMRHYADLIINAQHEVFLATNYWENSHSSGLVADAIRALSKRGIEEGRKEEDKAVVKVVYDRGTPAQAIRNHAPVPPEKWDSVGLPRPEDVKGIRMEVLNYHRPPLGTFHAKYIVVDRKVACINSNNIQDRPNVEMCVHLEGPIVESFYDVALFSWANKFEPPLPLLSSRPPKMENYKFGDENEHLKYIDTDFASKASRTLLGKQHEREEQQIKGEINDGGDTGVHGKDDLIGEHPAMKLPSDAGKAVKPESRDDADMQARQEREKFDGAGVKDRGGETDLEERQTRPASSTQQVQLSGSSDQQNKEDTTTSPDSANRPVGGPEILKSEEGNSGSKSGSVAEVTKHLNAATLHEEGTAEDDGSMDDFRPHILHAPHEPVPIAMVNRAPRGTPGHESPDDVPQNVAWLSLFKHAKETIFIQTPTFNSSLVIPATIDACKRGVQVTLYLDLGFNDLGELIPFQGGTNEQVVHTMYNTLNKDGKAENLKVYWYTAKDQKEPLSAARKSRNCHVKFMAVDSQVVMLGNGNQDTQSWFHSQETNVLIDAPQLAREWCAGIDANQNTKRFGRVDSKDGIWRAPDGSGRTVESSGVEIKGPLGGLKGIAGAIRRVRGTGGF